MKIAIIGAGPGDLALVSPYAQEKIRQADCVLTTERLFRVFSPLNDASHCVRMSEIANRIAAEAALEAQVSNRNRSGERLLAIIVSGDVGFYSLSNSMPPALPVHSVEWVNGFSSLQVLAALMQIPYDQVWTISVHGRKTSVVPHVCYHPAVFILTGGQVRAQDVLVQLVEAGLGNVSVAVGENLSMSNQRLLQGTARELAEVAFDDLSVMLVRNEAYVPAWKTVLDADLERGPVPMTKQEVRDVCLARLQIQPTDIVFDIGAGTGAVAVAMARRASAGEVLAIEKNPEALKLLEKNRTRLGAYNLRVIPGMAPAAMAGLPPPDKVFIGGSSGQIAPILDQVLSQNPKARLVVTAITIETLQEAIAFFKTHHLNPDIACLNVAKAETSGSYHLMKAQNPIYVISGEVTP